MRKIFIVFVGILLACYSCTEKKTTEKIDTPEIEIFMKEVLATYQNCSPDSISCTYSLIAYPQFTDSTRTIINEIITDNILLIASDFVKEESDQTTLTEVANTFVGDYEQFKNEFADYEFGWYLNIGAEIMYNSKDYVSYRIDVESFTGGAHPNSSSNFYILNADNGKDLQISDFVSDTVKFKKVLESAFRKAKELNDTISFADAGYYINDGDFILNGNIGMTENQILIHFNPYEIAPYSLGSTTIELEKSEVSSILKLE